MFKKYRRTNVAEMRPVTEEEAEMGYFDSLIEISISEADRMNGSPHINDYVARNPLNHNDQWLVAAKYFLENFEEIT